MQQESVTVSEIIDTKQNTSTRREYHFNFPLMVSYPLQIIGLSALTTPLERVQVIRQCSPGLSALGQHLTSNGAIISGWVISDKRKWMDAVFQRNKDQCLQDLR